MAKLNRPNGKLFGSSATNIGVFGSGQTSNPTTSTNPDAINTLDDHWEKGWNGAVVSQAPYTAPFVEDMNAVNYVNSYNGAYLLQQGIPEYSKNADYYVDSVCTYNGKIYMCILDNPAVNPDPDDPDPDAPPINYPLTDTTHWNERVELPDMNNNEVLVGSVGGTGVATDTLNQGDIVASSGGLNIKSGVIVNDDVKSDAAIKESKLALDHSTDSLNTAISGKAISNLADTTITTPIGDGDVVRYNTGSSKWENSNALTSHLADTNNPHGTSMSNLDDANVNDRQTLADGDVMQYDLVNGDWVNSPSLKNHLSDTNNPHTTTLANLDDTTITSPQDGDAIIYDNNSSKWINIPLPGGAISTLSDTTITSPQEGDLLQYDYANSKWVNSDDIPTRIEINDIANINNSATAVTLTVNDKRHQIFTATQGFDVKLPSTGVSAGEKFVFSFEPSSGDYYSTTSFCFKASDDSIINYAHNCKFDYIFTAKTNTPTTSTDWFFSWNLAKRMTLEGHMDAVISSTANQPTAHKYNDRFTIFAGYWDVYFAGGVTPALVNTANIYSGIVLIYSDAGPVQSMTTSERIGVMQCVYVPRTSVDGSSFTINGTSYQSRTMLPTSMSALAVVPYRSKAVTFFTRMVTVSSSASNQVTATAVANLVAPYTTSI